MRIAVFFPGIGYHCDKPLLYYSRKMVQEYGYEKIVTLSYSYEEKNIRGNEKKMQQAFECLYEQAHKSLEEIDFNQYSEILFISKSVGTIIASSYAAKYDLKCHHILYTPLKETFEYKHNDSIAFIGTSDPWSDDSYVKKLSESQGVPMYVYEEANHSLETSDTLQNLEILKNIMEKTSEFIR